VSGWLALEAALDAAARRGETIRFWWRDDDAGRASSALIRLLELAERQSAPLAVAVVPAWLEPNVQGRIAASAEATVLQHGYAHVNHAPKGVKTIELGGREAEAVLAELREGRAILQDAFGAAFLPALAPPWNRIDPELLPHLAGAGYIGLSVYGERPHVEAAPGVALVNAHLDPIDWRGTRGFLGEGAMLERLIGLLDLDEPIGVLSHHLDMDDGCWSFLERLLAMLTRHPAARLCPAPYLFARTDAASGSAA
jgi:hypothetical protein